MADRVFIFHETTDNFRAFTFAGAAQTGENWSPGFTNIRGAAANYTHIYVLDATAKIVRRWTAAQVREAAQDITLNDTSDTYSGIALTDTHLVAINRTENKLEYYDLTTRAYDATKDVTLPSLTSPEYFTGICRSGDFLYLYTEDEGAFTPRWYKRNLDGSAVSDFAGQNLTQALTAFAMRDRVVAVRKNGGHWDRWQFDGTQDTTLNTISSGLWAAAYTTFDLATVAFSTPTTLSNGRRRFNATWTGGHTGFAQDDLSVNLGTIASFTQTATPNVFQIEVTPPSTGSGTIVLTVRKDAVTEKNAAATFTVGTFSPPPPPPMSATLNLSFPVSVLDHGEKRTLTITSDMNVTLEAGDVTQTGGATLANFAGSGTSFTVDVTAPTSGSGNIVINIAEDAVPEMNDAVSLTIPYRNIQAPTISSALAKLVDGATTTALITFPNTVTTFGIGKISADVGTLSNFTVVTPGRVFRVTVTPPASGKGDITLSIAADVVPERNAAATHTIAYSYPATFTFSAPRTLLGQGETLPVTIDADKDVTEFVQGDITQTGGATLANFTKVRDSQYTVEVTAPETGEGDIVLSIAEDVVPEDNHAATFRIAYRDILAAPMDVAARSLSSTQVLVTWNAPDNLEIDTFEVGYAEGTAAITAWVPTNSKRTRFLVSGLKRGTAYTFRVRGRSGSKAGAASEPVTQTTPIASLHNALFFKECVNYLDNGERVRVHGDPTNIVRAAADNDYNTFTAEKDLVINISVNEAPTRVDAIFVKGIDIEAHAAVPTGGAGSGYSNRQMPAKVENWEGTEISTVVNGFQHDLYLLDTHFTATSVRMTFTGANAKIYEVMLLEFLLEIDANGDFTEIAPDYVDRSAVIHQSPDGGVRRSSPLGGERHKWETSYVVKIVPGKTLLTSVDEFVTQMGENPNVVHAQESSRYPAQIHPASFLLTRVPTRLRGDNKLLGDVVQFRVGEQ